MSWVIYAVWVSRYVLVSCWSAGAISFKDTTTTTRNADEGQKNFQLNGINISCQTDEYLQYSVLVP